MQKTWPSDPRTEPFEQSASVFARSVIFDFAPQVEIGAEILSRRGEDQRLIEERPAARRRREKDRAYHADEEISDVELDSEDDDA